MDYHKCPGCMAPFTCPRAHAAPIHGSNLNLPVYECLSFPGTIICAVCHSLETRLCMDRGSTEMRATFTLPVDSRRAFDAPIILKSSLKQLTVPTSQAKVLGLTLGDVWADAGKQLRAGGTSVWMLQNGREPLKRLIA